jgi:hypothetical protein
MKFSSAVTAIVVVLFAHTVTAVPCSECPRGLNKVINKATAIAGGITNVAENIKSVIDFKPAQSS